MKFLNSILIAAFFVAALSCGEEDQAEKNLNLGKTTGATGASAQSDELDRLLNLEQSQLQSPANEIVKLTAADGAANDNFGGRVSIDGDYSIVSAYRDDDNGADSGSAYIFVKNGASWSQMQKLTAPDGAAGDLFGSSVSISGDYAVVGASNKGAAYVFRRDSNIWVFEAKLISADAPSNGFGISVSISGSYIAVGAVGGFNNSAYIFARQGATWSQMAKLVASDGESGDSFGSSLAISGSYLIIGAYSDDSNKGSAYLFYKNESNLWIESAKLTASDGHSTDYFGISVAISDNYAVVGNNDSSAYIFARNNNTWSEMKKIVQPDSVSLDWFGASVSISGNYAMVGAFMNNYTGAAYLFYKDKGGVNNWGQIQKITASDSAGSDNFGGSVLIKGNSAIVGAYGNDDSGADSGSAYIFNVEYSPYGDSCTGCPGTCVDSVCCESATCDDGNLCTIDSCATSGNGTCTHSPAMAGTACGNNNDGICDGSGNCIEAQNCDDNNPCTNDSWDPASGCIHSEIPNGTTCDDGNACTTTASCQAGACTGANPVTCTASDQCHNAGSCDPATGLCSNPNKANGTLCEDGSECTFGDSCQAGNCSGGETKSCEATDQCHDSGSCDHATGDCSNPEKMMGTPCDDSSFETDGDMCSSGNCIGTPKDGSCETGISIAEFPFENGGTSLGRLSHISKYNESCGEESGTNPDAVFVLSAEKDVTYRILVSENNFVRIVADCEENLECVGGGNNFELTALETKSYFLIVESSLFEGGEYILSVEKVEITEPDDENIIDSDMLPDNDGTVADTDILTADSDVTVADTDILPEDNDAAVADTDILTADNDVTVADKDILPADNDVTVADTDILPVDNDVTVADTDILPADNDVTVADKDILPVDNDVTVADTDSSVLPDTQQNDTDSDTPKSDKKSSDSGCGCSVVF